MAYWIDFIGLTAIGAYCLGATVWASDFSEIHLSLPFLPFPIFLGEQLVVFCFVLLLLKQCLKPFSWSKWQKCLGVYLALIVLRALWDYAHWGAYAFRNAAMFYYPVFILFVCAFYNRRYFSPVLKFLAAAALCAVTSVFFPDSYFWFSCAVLFVILVQRLDPPFLRWLMLAAFLLFCNYKAVFCGSRTNLIGSGAAIVFLIYVYVRYFLRMDPRHKILAIAGLGLVLLAAVAFAADKNGIKSLLKFKGAVALYQDSEAVIESKRAGYIPVPLKVELYNDNREARRIAEADAVEQERGLKRRRHVQPSLEAVSSMPADGAKETAAQSAAPPALMAPGSAAPAPAALVPDAQPEPAATPSPSTTLLKAWVGKMFQAPGNRDLDLAQTNMVFRIFIWKDMWEELVRGKKWFGVGLGRPQRSPSLEILGWGTSEWGRDGWITPHNAYFHAVYRLGILGVGLVFGLFYAVARTNRPFVLERSSTGVLLAGILIYWLAAASTLLILEFPHYAIPFWSIFGLTLAYRYDRWSTLK